VSGWTLAKYVLALAGVVLVLLAERLGRPLVGYGGLTLIVGAFVLRFVQRRGTRGG
jgi:drug/metabolite transporter superfamily protein YnfA